MKNCGRRSGTSSFRCKWLFNLSLVAIFFVCAERTAVAGCAKDTDCKGDRICIDEECTYPDANRSTTRAGSPSAAPPAHAPIDSQQTAIFETEAKLESLKSKKSTATLLSLLGMAMSVGGLLITVNDDSGGNSGLLLCLGGAGLAVAGLAIVPSASEIEMTEKHLKELQGQRPKISHELDRTGIPRPHLATIRFSF